MAFLTVPEKMQMYFPKIVSPSDLWVKYNPHADSLTVYFTGEPVSTVWQDVDEYAYIGFAATDETTVTGVMVEHFSKWLLLPDKQPSELEIA